jgi:hypothetical protein
MSHDKPRHFHPIQIDEPGQFSVSPTHLTRLLFPAGASPDLFDKSLHFHPIQIDKPG